MFGVGTIGIETAGSDGVDIYLEDISNFREYAEFIDNQRKNIDDIGTNVLTVNAIPQSALNSINTDLTEVTELLRKILAELRNQKKQ